MSIYKNIFLVEDDETDRDFFLEALENTNPTMICRTATDGRHALDTLNRLASLPQLIFLDLSMPRMDGFEFLDRIKGEERFKDIPVVVLSTTIHEEGLCEGRGAALSFSKPSSIKYLQTILSTLFNFDITKDSEVLRSLISYKIRAGE